MAKALKIIGIIVLVLIILLGAGIFSIIHFVDPNKFKDEISTAVYDHTGRRLSINGNLSWSFFPWLGFKVNQVDLSNASGFGSKPFAEAKKIDISLRVMPLLSGHVEVSNIELDGLSVNLMKNSAGQTNWHDFSSATSKNPTSNAQPVSASANSPAAQTATENNVNFSIANLTIVNGSINWDDQQTKQQYTVSNIYVNGSNVGTQKVFPLTIAANVKSTALPKPVKLTLNGQYNINNDLNGLAINQIEIGVNELKIKGDVSVNNLSSTTKFQGDLNVDSLNLKKFLANFAITPPKMRKNDALENISTDLAFNGNKNEISIKPLNISVDKSKLSGNLDIKNFSSPAVTFKLAIDKLNVDDYLAPKPKKVDSKTNTQTAAVPAASIKTDTPINLPIAMLRQLNLDGSLAINQFIISGLHLSSFSSTLTAKQGLIKLSPIKVDLYEGNATANANLNVQGSTPAYQLSMNINKIQIEPFLNDLMDKDFLTGTANLAASMTTDGNSVNTLISRLDGNSKFDISKGLIKGVNIDYQLDRAKTMLKKQPAPAKPKANTTPFGDLSGTIQINNGVATNNDLTLTNPAFVAKGKGKADLNQQTLDYEMDLTTTKVDELNGYRVPIDIKGPLTAPSINLDTDDILQQIIQQQKKQLQSKAKQRAKSELEKHIGEHVNNKHLNQALDKLFG